MTMMKKKRLMRLAPLPVIVLEVILQDNANLVQWCGSFSVVWKFFSALQGRKSVQCQLCPVGNNDGLLAYHGGTSSMREHLKRRHYTAFCEAITNDSSDTPSTSKQTRLDSLPVVLCVLGPVQWLLQTV